MLGSLYDEGDGVPKDIVQAQVWWTLAARQEPALVELRDAGRERLSPAQLEEVDKRVQAWQPIPIETQSIGRM